ncbi:MAG: GntR family transcriptional regulator [Bryobacterales bacterium]|nr:GntR family transcriptional regulator [Bryobacterales bacterium]
MPRKAKSNKEGEVDRVYRLLKTWILDGRLRPGEFLSEVELARQCSTSRTPIREAFNLLSKENWVQRIRHKGHMIPLISIREVVEMYEYRKVLECFAAERAATGANPDEIVGLRATIQGEDHEMDFQKFVKANEAFHIRLSEIARNKYMLEQLKLTLQHVHRLDVLSTQRDSQRILHTEIMQAIEARQPVEASRAMARHIDTSRDRMLKLFGT